MKISNAFLRMERRFQADKFNFPQMQLSPISYKLNDNMQPK